MNIKDKLRWKSAEHSERLYINGIRLGAIWHNATSSRGQDNYSYEGRVLLPGRAQSLYGATSEEVKALVESLVIAWFDEVTKEEK